MQQIYAHRGASGDAPENTLEAFELAVRQGAAGVELDVHLSRDGELVVAHDETVDRVSDGHGRLCDMTVCELKRLRFNRTHPEYAHATLPTLREVFELLRPTGLAVNVELKNSCIDYPGLERRCVELAAELDMTDRVLYSSFNHYSLLRVKALDAALPVGLLYEGTMVEPWRYAKALGADALHPHFTQLQAPNVTADAHAQGVRVNVWTPNAQEDIRFALEAGADIVITNYPERALALLRELG